MPEKTASEHPPIADLKHGVGLNSCDRLGNRVKGAGLLQQIDLHKPLELITQTLRDYLGGLHEYKTLGLSVFTAIFCTVILYAFLGTPIYRSVATIMLQDKGGRDIDPKGKIANDVAFQRYIDTEVGTLRLMTVSEHVVNKMDLSNKSEFREGKKSWLRSMFTGFSSLFSSADPGSAELDRIKGVIQSAKEVAQRLTVRQVGKGQLLEVSMDASTPEMAQSLLQTYLDCYLETKVNVDRKTSIDDLRWLEDEIRHVQRGLVESEAALVRFIADHGIVPSDDGGLSEVVDVIKRQKEGVLKVHDLKAKLQGLQKGASPAGYNIGGTEVTEDEAIKKIKENLAAMENEHNKLVGVYSESHPRAAVIKKRIRMMEERLADLQNQSVASALEATQKASEVMTTSVQSTKEEVVRIGNLGAQYAILKKDVDTNKELHNILLKDYKETLVKSRMGQAAITITDPPSMPLTPVWPRKGLLSVMGCILGIFGGVFAVLARHFWDSARDTTAALEKEFNLTKLGIVPDAAKLSEFYPNTPHELVSYDQPTSPVGDSVRNIQASIRLATLGRKDISSVLVSSAAPGEGKTFISVSLATAFTCNNSFSNPSNNRKVLLVDCDMRRPSVHNLFSEQMNIFGLTTLLTSDGVLAESVICKLDSVPGLYYLPAGSDASDPAALLMSDRFAEIINELKNTFDLIIFDSPPVLGFPDSRIIAGHSDGVVMVVQEGYMGRTDIRNALSAIEAVPGGSILGFVVNKARPSRTHLAYGSYYYTKKDRNGNKRKCN